MKNTISLGCLAVLSACVPALAQSYTLVDLGAINGESHAFAISRTAAGFVTTVGSSTDFASNFQSLLYSPDPSPNPRLPGFAQAVGFDVLPDGRTIGAAYNLGGMTWHAFASEGSTVTDLGHFAARAGNQLGDVVGTTTFTTATFGGLQLPRACILTETGLTVLPTLGGQSSQALGVDALRRVVGSSLNTGDIAPRTCMWVNNLPSDLGTLGGTLGQAYDVRGPSVVGLSTLASGLAHATRWNLSATNAVLSRTDLGALTPSEPSAAHAINAAGDIVGTSNFRAVLWHNSAITDLNTLAQAPGWVLETAWDIDDRGNIVGSGTYLGFPRAFLLTPGTPCLCAGDFNCDSGVDGDDVIEFFAAWDLSLPTADINGSGGVDGDDVIVFFGRWDAGC